jgi:phosphatidylserine/phosphatidylglycerophosphate/cardiolipin synthase-like enzyme
MLEYNRPKWTWHGKGLWITSPKSSTMTTVIGSSNMNYRSLNRDLEAQLVVVTCDPKLISDLNSNLRMLMEHTRAVDLKMLNKRKYPVLLQLATHAIKKML